MAPLAIIDREPATPCGLSKQDMTEAVVDAFRYVLADEEMASRFWHKGYQELVSHAEGNASRWIGRRLLTVFVAAVVSAGLVWLVKSGAIK